MLTEQDIIDRLHVAIAKAGSQRAFAQQYKLSAAYVNDVVRRRREPGQKILDALGVDRVVTYREKSSEQQPR